MTPRQRSLVGGISILAVAGLICKVVGVLYRIPLANLIGPPGMGVYNQVFPTYNLMLAISSAGIPVAISRMVAGSLARGDAGNARRTF
ncbi:MAG: oligosaccharide flippase family protein, partial [Eubacteriales bacterium]|nr:oligosaccharide flippase family protein [Eubacteriales bacterium]